MEETVAVGQSLHQAEARVVPAEPVHVDIAELVHHLDGQLPRPGVREDAQLAAGVGLVGLVEVAFEDQGQVEQELGSAGEQVGLFDGPEPEGAPVVHHQLEPAEGAGLAHLAGEDLLLVDAVLGLGGGGPGGGFRLGLAEHGERVGGAAVDVALHGDVPLP